MTNISKKELVNHVDCNFQRSIDIEPKTKIRKRDGLRDFDITAEYERKMRLRQENDTTVKRYEEIIAEEYAFENIKVYELYRAEMHSYHDIYRKLQMSRVWKHNQLFDASQDSLPYETKNNRLWFNNACWLKKIDYLQMRIIQSDSNMLEAGKWRDSTIMLNDNNGLHLQAKKTPCKKMELFASIYSNIKTRLEYSLNINLYSVNGQYFQEYIEKPLQPVLKNNKDVLIDKKMSRRGQKPLESNHISRYSRYFGNDYAISKELLEKTEYNFTGKNLGAFIQKSLDNDKLSEKLNKPISEAENKRDIDYQKSDMEYFDKVNDIPIKRNDDRDSYEINLNNENIAEYMEVTE